ncbi:MAG: CAP domain-containing protein [Chitinophagaceae bacterium]|nr:CAP domain-containing protein [Chitinophagaceae bacterium]
MFKTILLGLCAISCIAFVSVANDNLAKEVLRETNQFRKSRSKKELVWHDGLSEIARKHSEAMANGTMPFGHKDFKLREKEARKVLDGKLSAIAENVAYGSNTAEDVVAMWKNSPGHRQNMLGNFRYIGVGTAKSKDGTIYFTQIFVE